MTRFREAHDQVGRAWVTIDGVEVLDCSYYRRAIAVSKEHHALMKGTVPGKDYSDYLKKWSATYDASRKKADENFLFDEGTFRKAILAYLDISIKDALVSKNHLIKAFALIDRRLGRRTFEEIHLAEDEQPLVHTFYELRSRVFDLAAHSRN